MWVKISFFFFLLRVFLARIRFNVILSVKWFFYRYPLLEPKFIKQASQQEVKNFIKNKISLNNMVSKIPITWIMFFYLVGFFTVLNQLKVYWNFKPITVLVLMLAVIFIFIVLSENSLVKLISLFFYWLCVLTILLVWFPLEQTSIWHYYLRLFILLTIVRPFWHFLTELLFFLLLKQIYPYPWFQKLLPYLSPNFNSQEIKNPNENGDSKNHT